MNLFGSILSRILPLAAYCIINVIARTLRLQIINTAGTINASKDGRNFIFAFWHDQFLLMPYFYKAYLKKTSIAVLTSLSKDGEYISRVIEMFGFTAIRGSSSRGGDTAMRLLVRQIENGFDIAITPDGPRGPRHIVQPGIIALAELTGCEIIPVGYIIQNKKVLNTWDRFIIPKLFSPGKLIAGEPVSVPENATEDEKEQKRKILQNTLLSISEP